MKQRILPALAALSALASVTAVIFAAAFTGCNRQPEPPPSGLLDIKHLDGTPPESGWALLQHRAFNGWTYLYSPIGDTLWFDPSSGPLIAPLAFANPHQETVDRVVCRTHHHRYGWSPTVRYETSDPMASCLSIEVAAPITYRFYVRSISESFEYADRFYLLPAQYAGLDDLGFQLLNHAQYHYLPAVVGAPPLDMNWWVESHDEFPFDAQFAIVATEQGGNHQVVGQISIPLRASQLFDSIPHFIFP